MIALEPRHRFAPTATPCPRCEKHVGKSAERTEWLTELTIHDGVRSVHAVLCRRPSCGFSEIRALVADPLPAPAQPRQASWLRAAGRRYPLTFALAAFVYVVAFGLLLALR